MSLAKYHTHKMKLELLYHPFSPFAQKVWIWALESKVASQIQLHKVVVAPVPFPGWSDNNDKVGAWNPIAKIPTLIVDLEDGSDKFAVHDSKIICDFLTSLVTSKQSASGAEGVDVLQWKRQSLHRAIDGMMDCEILVIYEEKIRKDAGMYYQKWVDGMRTKIERSFDLMEKAVQDGTLRSKDGNQAKDIVGLEECAAVAALALFDTRMPHWSTGREKLCKWYETWKQRQSYVDSRNAVDWRLNARMLEKTKSNL